MNDRLEPFESGCDGKGKYIYEKNERARFLFQVLLPSLAVAIKCEKREESHWIAAV